MSRMMLHVELDEETGELTIVSPTREETLNLFEHMENVKKVPLSVNIDANKPGVALLITLSNVITRSVQRARIEALHKMLQAAGLPVLVEDDAIVIEEETKH